MLGVDECPTGTVAITDTSKCAEGSLELGFGEIFDETLGTKTGGNLICNYCTGCNPVVTRVSSNHGALASWICEKTIGNVLLILLMVRYLTYSVFLKCV